MAGAPHGPGGPSSSRGQGDDSSPPDGASAGPRLSLGPPVAGEGPRPPTAARPPRLVGNRDWFVLVECAADALVIYPGGQRFPAPALASEPASARGLLETVRGLIAKREAMVRPGEPPYRPQIRFLVRPDGLRTFYLAYPLLEPAGVPMSRRNLEADEEIK